jgi:hypothetical protein
MCGRRWKCGKEDRRQKRTQGAKFCPNWGQCLCKSGLWSRRGGESRRSAKPQTELSCNLAMAKQTQRPEIVEIALSPTLGDRTDVVSIPQGASGCDGLQSIEVQSGDAGRASCTFQGIPGSNRIDIADRTSPSITGEHLVAEIARICPKPPLVDAVVATEGPAPFGHNLKIAPATERKSVRPNGERVGGSPATGKSARRKHAPRRIRFRFICPKSAQLSVSIFSLGQTSKSTSSGSIRGISQVSSFW